MNEDPISETRLAEIAAVLDEDIDTSDIPEADEAWFRGARLVLPKNTFQNSRTGSAVSRQRQRAGMDRNLQTNVPRMPLSERARFTVTGPRQGDVAS